MSTPLENGADWRHSAACRCEDPVALLLVAVPAALHLGRRFGRFKPPAAAARPGGDPARYLATGPGA